MNLIEHDLRGGPVLVEIFCMCSDIFELVLLKDLALIALLMIGMLIAAGRDLCVVDLTEWLKLDPLSIDS